ncbi:MAG: cupin domain-containing protein [Planctomycetota bacterium]
MPLADSAADTFRSFEIRSGAMLDLSNDVFPSRLCGWTGSEELEPGGAHFGYVVRGTAELGCASGRFSLRAGMYFCATGELTLEGGEGIVVTRLGHDALFQIGGPVEQRGRLRYIDGCTDSLLVPPTIQGDPCLNLLHIPAGTQQTQHTHPSHRIGMIIRGSGHCITPQRAVPLAPGLVFHIREGGRHSFHTGEEDLLVLAYHPDSDFGPTHEHHPMINRTVLGDAGAAR